MYKIGNFNRRTRHEKYFCIGPDAGHGAEPGSLRRDGTSRRTTPGDEAPATDSAGTGSEVEELTINLYNPVAGTVTDNSYTLFAERVSELSGGKITCNITPAGTLGAERGGHCSC